MDIIFKETISLIIKLPILCTALIYLVKKQFWELVFKASKQILISERPQSIHGSVHPEDTIYKCLLSFFFSLC